MPPPGLPGPAVTLREAIIDPPYGLYRQAWAPRTMRNSGTMNVDGFGVGWYADGQPIPARYRRQGPIWADPSFADLTRVTRSGALLAAVRDASAGTEPGASACSPFGADHWLFSHNGALAGWPETAAGLAASLTPLELLDLDARVDSALLWALTLKQAAAWRRPGRGPGRGHRPARHRPGRRAVQLPADRRELDRGDRRRAHALVPADGGQQPGQRCRADEDGGQRSRGVGARRRGARLDRGAGPVAAHRHRGRRARPVAAHSPGGRRRRRRAGPARKFPRRNGRQQHPPRKGPALMTTPLSVERRLPDGFLASSLRADARAGLTSVPKSHAMKDKRVYATEDSNLRIMYKVNNAVMGSALKNPEALNVSVDIKDPDANDKIKRVSIISDGGVVAATKDFDSNEVKWQFKLDAKYNYYYVRVEEADKDIAVTAPVWTGEVVPVGIGKVEASMALAQANTPIDITAAVYNNGTTDIKNAKVEFFKNEINDKNKIGEDNLEVIAKGSVQTAKLNWKPSQIGDYTIYAKMVLNVDGKEKVFTGSTKVQIQDADSLVKVVIDAGHQNQYVSGDYKGKITALKSLLNDRKAMVVENKDEITDSDLKDSRLLILTDPQSTDKEKNKLVKSKYSDKEIEVIKKFVQDGGNVILTSRADFGDGIGEYGNAVQGNKVLEAIGSNLRFNDDEVVDDSKFDKDTFRLKFNKYTSSKYNLTKDIPEGQMYSFYSGCSVITKAQADLSNIDYLVMGHDTTYAMDSDKQKDNISVEKGKVCALAAEKLPCGGNVIAAGTTFFSDFEMTGDNTNSNVQITKNILEWMASPKPAELKTIAEIKADKDKDGVLDNLGKRYSIEGIVTAQSEAVTPKNAFFEVVYVQDATGGITVFGISKTPLPLGTKVKVTGFVDQYQGDSELQIENEDVDLEILDEKSKHYWSKINDNKG